MRPLAQAVGRVTSKNFTRKFISIGRIVTNWKDIMGLELAQKAQPVKIHYRKSISKDKKAQACLEIACSPAHSTLLHYQKDLILERISQVFGERWITDIKFTDIPFQEHKNTSIRSKPILSECDKDSLQSMLKDIKDPEIKERLLSLGQAIMMEEKL